MNHFSAICCTLAVLVLGTLPLAAAPERPNIVFILADDLGVNDLGCYGRKEHDTPNLDRLAAQGLRFTNAYCAQPICSPTRAALMTGKAPARLHLTTYLPGRPNADSQKLLHPKITPHLPLDETTIGEYLKPVGYKTGYFGKWHLGGMGMSPLQQGFDVYYPGKANTMPSATEGGKGEFELTQQALKFVDDNRDRPFFLYLAHNNPHIPLQAKQELVDKYKNTFNPIYAGMIHSLDETVGLVLARLDELKLTERTLVIFTSDNGGLHVPEHVNTPATHNSPFRAGKGHLYEGGLRVPLIVRWPGIVPVGKVSDVPVISMDLAPTLLEAAQVKTENMFDGVSLGGLFRTGQLSARSLFWHFPHYTNQGGRPGGAIRSGDWKLVEQYEDGRIELYNLTDDVGETISVSERHPERVKELKSRLNDWRKDLAVQTNTPNPRFDAALHKKIYIDTDISKLRPGKTAAEMRPSVQQWHDLLLSAIRPAKSK